MPPEVCELGLGAVGEVDSGGAFDVGVSRGVVLLVELVASILDIEVALVRS